MKFGRMRFIGWTLTILIVGFWQDVKGTDYFLAANGNDSNADTSTNAPWLRLQKAGAKMTNCGDILYVTQHGGDYDSAVVQQFFSPGTANSKMLVISNPAALASAVNGNAEADGRLLATYCAPL